MADVTVHPECPFSEETFNLLSQLEQDFYIAHEEEFKKYVEQPLQKLCHQVAAQLPGEIIKRIEMKLDVAPNFTFNNYECNLYQKSTNFTSQNARLFIDLVQDGFLFGLFIIDKTPDKQRFIQNSQKTLTKEVIIQNTQLSDKCSLHSSSKKSLDHINLLGDWLRHLARQNSVTKNIQASVYISLKQVLMYSEKQLTDQIIQTLKGLFPLFLLATYDDPITAIRKYLYPPAIRFAEFYYNQGLAKYNQGEYQDSINNFERALERSPDLAEAYSYRGQAKAELGDINGAIADYNHLLLIQPKNAEAYNNRANAYHKLKDYEAAIKDYNQALDINPNFVLAYYHRGRTYLELENQEKAIEDLCRAVELFDPEKDMDDYEEAQRILKTVQPDYSEPSFTEIYLNVRSKSLRIAERTLRRYHLALKTRKFVILSGISGTGKTWLTKAYADAVKAKYLPVPVAPNWTTNEDLLGYLNPITNEEYHYTDFSRFLEEAEKEYKQAQEEKRTPKPYHLVLDEMNLARVEYYFAKFLSAMEVRMREGEAKIELAPDKQVSLPPNLYFIGTVNMDETTQGFAEKVYDRAQLIELEVSREELEEHLGKAPYREILMNIWDSVHVVAPFAFRVLDEIQTYLEEARKLKEAESSERLDNVWKEALDEQLLQKILPKLKGVDERVGEALKTFVEIAENEGFQLSHAKAAAMLETFNKHGFTSYF
ncbi:MAG: tetratricopeptide repeat protein [Kastovskya adunca ATA6-11-RM4]|jgi:tetratricopeptide (TPR) repeat protein|nr:tetratricopeptide repeat protein [Kastovskya adunca ATA6-11-RM4]